MTLWTESTRLLRELFASPKRSNATNPRPRRVNPLGRGIEELEGRVVPTVVTNGGFEGGTLVGWTSTLTGGQANAVASYVGDNVTYTAAHGTFFAKVSAGDEDSPQSISQSFTAAAGTVISGSAFFDAIDYLPFDDNASVVITGPGGSVTLFSSSVSAVGDHGETPWTPFTYTLPVTGTYTLVASATNVEDSGVDSVLGLDMAVSAKRFDMKAATGGTLPADWTRVAPTTKFSNALGYGWLSTTGIGAGKTLAPSPLPPGGDANVYSDYNVVGSAATFKVFVGVNQTATVKVSAYALPIAGFLVSGVTAKAEGGTTATASFLGGNTYLAVVGNGGADGVLDVTISKAVGAAFGAVNGIEVFT